eukprot:CAMPEP_0177226486 /NCGR_PEP_ID=MMETSP0367-20130122/40111_1 /TAXON_ID=447022 ORGANISM="Scrippsiella hangoei-like, Strain SHHI-4" /NCGR_SAMPLE_ID=MMETSP0367 /ASSEMBLY_ACC=CAM_ASM_000362 /LENGTH=32 /DNA_ID= /DNA_START= /DNA_END= /DNA_ORIENTATION=
MICSHCVQPILGLFKGPTAKSSSSSVSWHECC